MNKTVTFCELEKNNDVANSHPTISAQKKQQANSQTKLFTNLNCLMWEKKWKIENQRKKMIKQLGFNNRKNHSKYNGRYNNIEIKKP